MLSSYYINKAILVMRANASLTARVVSQGLFNEKVDILACEGKWALIRTPDHYEGWVLRDFLVEGAVNYAADLKTCRLSAALYAQPDVEYGPIHLIPDGISLKKRHRVDERWIKVILPSQQECYIQAGDVEIASCLKKAELPLYSQRFLGLPYLWGGRSSLGFDCSGFIQMLYEKIGITLPRDSCQQARDARFITVDLQKLTPGDLIFFGRSKECISHVGMSIGRQVFVHASTKENMPWVRVSHLLDFQWSGDTHAYYAYRTARQLST